MTLRKNAKRFNLDTTQHFYQAMAEAIYATVDDLDQMFIENSSNISGKCGAEMIAVLVVGQKLFTITLGDLQCHLTRRTEVNELCIPLSYVGSSYHRPEREREGGSKGAVIMSVSVKHSFSPLLLEL